VRWLGLVAFVTACGFAPASINATGGDARLDDAIDAPRDTPDAPNANCFGSHAIDRVCLDTLPTSGNNFTGHDFDTDGPTCFVTTANGVPVCVVAYTSITITTSSLAIAGSKPLVLVATTGAITINTGRVDIGSHLASPGLVPGGQSGAACTVGATAATSFGGGYGGTFTRTGGGGGIDNSGDGAGAPANAQSSPTKLAGGCPGNVGGGNASAASLPGGAIALIASTITINGTLTAGGAGGAGTGGTGANVGGNGGGSGGLIVLDAAMNLNGAGAILAQGGGGGEGSAGNTGLDGHDGYDTTNAGFSTLPGAGGSPSGGDGGQGGGLTAALAGSQGTQGGPQTGGGGGGGGAGITLVYGATPAVTLSFSPAHD
jgi:hypothetical protein